MTNVEPAAHEEIDAEIALRLRAYARQADSRSSGIAVAQRVARMHPRQHGLTAALGATLEGLSIAPSTRRWVSFAMVAALLVAAGALVVLAAGGWATRHGTRSLLFARHGELIAAGADGEPEVQLGPAAQAASSPDGTWIAVARLQATGGRDLWVMRRDGTEARRVAVGCGIDGPWSPDGRAILALCGSSLSVVDVTTDSVRSLAGLHVWKDAVSGTWSPDGSRIALAQKDSIVVVGADGTKPMVIAIDALAWLPRWSPDGTTIAYATPSGVRLVHPDGTDDHVLAESNGSPCNLAWAPDGRSIAFARAACLGSGPSGMVDVTTGQVRPLAASIPGRSVLDVTWAPDGTRLALVVGSAGCQPGEASIWLVDRDGSNARNLAANADCGFAADGGLGW